MKPSNVPTGRVTGRFIIGVEDGSDPDDDPDYIAAKGVVELQMSVPYIPNPTADPAPVTMLNARRRMILDAEGYACAPDPTDPTKPGARGMRLEADGSPDALVSGWTWNVTYRFEPVNGSAPSIPAHSFVMLPDAVEDLTKMVKVPSSPGYGLPQSEAAVLRAEGAAVESAQSASDAEAAALDVVARANAGEFDGKQGLPGNARMRVDTTVGTRVFITDGVTEHMVSGDTGWRDVTTLLVPGNTLSGSLHIRRTADRVYVRFLALELLPGTGILQLMSAGSIPIGFRAVNNTREHSFVGRDTNATVLEDLAMYGPYAWVGSTNRGTWSEVRGAGHRLQGVASWYTDQTWPTALPGTPA